MSHSHTTTSTRPPKVLERLHPVPVAYLKTLAGHGDLFLKLPYSVQRQVWEMDRKLLQQHMLPLINGCAYESCTLSSLLDMDDTLPLTRTFRRAGAALALLDVCCVVLLDIAPNPWLCFGKPTPPCCMRHAYTSPTRASARTHPLHDHRHAAPLSAHAARKL